MEKTFKLEGEEFQYPISYSNATDTERREYRQAVINSYLQRKMEAKLKNLPFREKARRYFKNAGLEFLASTIEGLSFPLLSGGLRVNCDELRERKEITYLSFTSAMLEKCFPKRIVH